MELIERQRMLSQFLSRVITRYNEVLRGVYNDCGG